MENLFVIQYSASTLKQGPLCILMKSKRNIFITQCILIKKSFHSQSIYISENANPMYKDEPGCKHLGQLTMDISDTTGGVKRQFAAKLKFGGTEIHHKDIILIHKSASLSA